MALNFLPPGFRFHPTDVELVLYYLKRKIMGKKLLYEAIAEVNIYKFSPWDLPDKSCLKSRDLEWFFFCPRERKYASGSRIKRATENGYWKTTGKDRSIHYNGSTIGTVKTLVFHLGHAPQGERTDWVIYEYKILDDKLAAEGMQDSYVLCKVFKKDGMGPKNGAQYGAPFNEAEWADDGYPEKCAISFAPDGPPLTLPMQTEEETIVRGISPPGDTSESHLVAQGPPPSAGGTRSEVFAVETDDNDIVRLLASFSDEDILLSNDNGDLIGNIENEILPCSDGHDIFNDLGDLGSWCPTTNEGVLDFPVLQNDAYYLNNMPFQDNSTYIELDDLLTTMDCSNGVATTDQLPNNETLETHSHVTFEQFYSGASFSGMGQYAPCSNQLPALPSTSFEVNDLDLFQIVEQQVYQGSSNASSGLHFTSGPLNNLGYMERGSQKLESFSRFMGCIPPAHQIPTAAELLALAYLRSSIHIKAEVTHRAGECTKEALSVMMGGSGSCWCYCQKLLVEFCHLSVTISQSCYYCLCYNYHHHHLDDEDSFIIFFSLTTIIGKLIDSFLNIVTLQIFSKYTMFNNCLVKESLLASFLLCFA